MDNQKFVPFWLNDNATIKNSLNIILLAHVQQPRGYTNLTQLQCSETERFSVEEFNEIYQGIVTAGYYIQAVYFNEIDFISDYANNPEQFKNSLIYNLARNGQGDNKKTIIPAFCELVFLNYITSDSLTCALCRNKYYFNTLLQAHNISVPQSWLFSETGVWIGGAPPDGTQVICKPCSESASQGIDESKIVVATPNLHNLLSGARYIVQEYIDGIECEVPILKTGNTISVLPPVGIDLCGSRILDEQASAENHYNFYQLCNTCPPTIISNVQSVAKKAFQLLQMDIYGRIDFRISSDGIPYIFDISTTPYTTKHSSFAFAFEQMGFEYSDIYRAIISAALLRTKSICQKDRN